MVMFVRPSNSQAHNLYIKKTHNTNLKQKGIGGHIHWHLRTQLDMPKISIVWKLH